MATLRAWDGNEWAQVKALHTWNGSSWVPATGYYYDGEKWVPFIGSSVIWLLSRDGTIYEVDPEDFSVVRSASSPPSSEPTSIGGDRNVIWHCGVVSLTPEGATGLIYELSPDDFSVVRSSYFFDGIPDDLYLRPNGIGGTRDVIWLCTGGLTTVYRINPEDFSIDFLAGGPTSNGLDIGGDGDSVWFYGVNFFILEVGIYELDRDDFSVVRSDPGPTESNSGGIGIGGSSSVIWFVDEDTGLIYQLDPTDFSIIRTGNSPTAEPISIGGK